MKNLISVKFLGNDKQYYYWTKLNLVEGAVYDVVADNRTVYKTPVMIAGVKRDECADRRTINGIGLREITNATVIQGAPRPKSLVERVIYNPKKKVTTVFWTDGFPVTCVKQHECEEYDGEKALAMAFMKRAYDNRGCFNEDLKKFAVEMPKKARVRRVKHD